MVVELPPEVTDYVQALRSAYAPRYTPVPVEITVIGSSGIGILTSAQSPSDIGMHEENEVSVLDFTCPGYYG